MTTLIPDSWELPGYLAAGQSRGRQDADDWLARNSPESFEHPPAPTDNESWMREREGDPDEGYVHWEPSPSDYTYTDFGDAAGQSFEGGDSSEGQSHVLPGSAYQPEHESDPTVDRSYRNGWTDRDWDMYHHNPGALRSTIHQPVDHDDEEHDEDEDGGVLPYEHSLVDHGFTWRVRNNANDSPSGSQAEWVHHQNDLEGNHIATHAIHQDDRGRWNLHSAPAPGNSDFSERHTSAQWPDDMIDQFRQNSAEALLPSQGYEPDRGRTGWARGWHRTDPAPAGAGHDEPYHHEISFPEEGGGFLGTTSNSRMTQPNYAHHGVQVHHASDVGELVRAQNRIGNGSHPGGAQDRRLTGNELLAHPSVAALGRTETVSQPQGDGLITRATWRLSHPGTPHPVRADASYNWDTGNYDFGYRHNGFTLAPTHNYVPDGAPVTVPGRQPQPSPGSVR